MIVTVSFDKLLEQSQIEESKIDRKVKKLLDILEGVEHIQQIKLPITELRKMKPKIVEKKTI